MEISLKQMIIVLLLINFSSTKFLAEEEEKKKEITEVKIKFDLSDTKIKLPEEHDIQDTSYKVKESFFMPKSKLTKSGYTFQGWTADGLYGHEPGDVYYITEERAKEEIIFSPLFVDKNDKNFYYLEYKAELDGEIIDTSEMITIGSYKKNQIVETDLLSIPHDKASQKGWLYEGHLFEHAAKLVMPDHDITLTASWHYYHNITYLTGDVEGVVGNTAEVHRLCEGASNELPEATRFSRRGYKIIGWHCDFDDKDYKLLQTYTMPDSEVNFYAIWSPIEYAIVFRPEVSGVSNIKIKGKTGTTIIVPDLEEGTEKEGYTFAGWSYKNPDEKDGKEVIYMPGDEFYIEGVKPGIGISLKAVWEKN